MLLLFRSVLHYKGQCPCFILPETHWQGADDAGKKRFSRVKKKAAHGFCFITVTEDWLHSWKQAYKSDKNITLASNIQCLDPLQMDFSISVKITLVWHIIRRQTPDRHIQPGGASPPISSLPRKPLRLIEKESQRERQHPFKKVHVFFNKKHSQRSN